MFVNYDYVEGQFVKNSRKKKESGNKLQMGYEYEQCSDVFFKKKK